MTPEQKTALLLVLSDSKEFCEGFSDGTFDAMPSEHEAIRLVPRLNEAIAIVNRI